MFQWDEFRVYTDFLSLEWSIRDIRDTENIENEQSAGVTRFCVLFSFRSLRDTIVPRFVSTRFRDCLPFKTSDAQEKTITKKNERDISEEKIKWGEILNMKIEELLRAPLFQQHSDLQANKSYVVLQSQNNFVRLVFDYHFHPSYASSRKWHLHGSRSLKKIFSESPPLPPILFPTVLKDYPHNVISVLHLLFCF